MTTHDLSSWSEFEERLEQLRTEQNAQAHDGRPKFLFRGQASAQWALTTTLERTGRDRWGLLEYFRLVSRINPQVESFTGADWKVPSVPEYMEWLKAYDTLMPSRYQAYEYFVYLRHHGFPSPLLDWSRSVYVAAFFAFRNAKASDRVAVFAYLEAPDGVKARSSASPCIYGLGPYVRTHRRHFIQQSEYTICLVRDNEWLYAEHESAFGRGVDRQDLVWKFTLPGAERQSVLQRLDSQNVNDLSLFGSEESLLQTMALRELEFKPREAG